jgi:hypothetical protein
MDKYLEQLIELIHAAYSNSPANKLITTDKDHFNRWKYILKHKELFQNRFVCTSENGSIGIEFCSYDAESCGVPYEMCCCGEWE